MNPRLGVVTVTYNSAAVVREFMDCALGQTVAGFSLILIDNASSDATLQKLAGYADPKVFVVANRSNVGVAAANNQGIQLALASGHTHVLLINNDVTFGPGLFEKLLAAAERLHAHMVAPKIHFGGDPQRLWYAGGGFCLPRPFPATQRGFLELDRGQFDRTEQVDYSPTCCLLIHSAVFKWIGLMDESYFVYSDDVDFCYRARQAGLSLYYEPSATLVHNVGSLTGRLSNFAAHYMTRNNVYFIRKHFGVCGVCVRLLCLQLHFLKQLLRGRTTWSHYRNQQWWFSEGLSMSIPPDGTGSLQ